MTGFGSVPPAGPRAFVRFEGEARHQERAAVAEEVPVAFVYGGKPHVVMMCTPTDLEDLAVGFTISEEIVASAKEIARGEVVRHARGIEVQMELPPAAQERLASRTRALASRTGCGLCGIDAIESAIRPPRRVASDTRFTAAAVAHAVTTLEAAQPLNAETRAVHAAAYATAAGVLEVVREDVGRHNALDKVIGALARGGHDASAGFLVVTSRASYELVQKCAVAGATMLVAVSRPTGLAIRFAEEAGITLVALARGETANVYAHADRLA